MLFKKRSDRKATPNTSNQETYRGSTASVETEI